MVRKLAYLLLILMAGTSAFAADSGAIAGTVRDSAGVPQMGAIVEVFTSAATLGATVFTDSRGFYSVENLSPGTYFVKVSAAAFLPALRENVSLRPGARVLVNVTLNAMAGALTSLPARRSATTEPDDWHWVLRSSANRPVLRAVDPDSSVASSDAQETEDHTLKARLSFIAGSEAGGFGSAGDVTTVFALEKSMFGDGTFSFGGDIGTAG